MWKLYLGDCLEVMPGLDDNSVAVVITDPPYGINYQMNAPSNLNYVIRNTERMFGADDLVTCWIDRAYDLLVKDSFLYMFTRWDVIAPWKAALENAGFAISQRLIWNKSHWGAGDLRYYGSQTEDVLFCRKGSPSMKWSGRKGNIFKTVSRAYFPERSDLHPTQKPESVIRCWIEDSTSPGDIILDPFMGSGTTGVACAQTGRNFIGIEIDPKYFAIAEKRIAEARLQIRMGL
jgi:DNA modification methylase